MKRRGGGSAYRIINNMLISCIVVDVDRDVAEGGDFALQGGEGFVILPVISTPLSVSLILLRTRRKGSKKSEWEECTFRARRLETL